MLLGQANTIVMNRLYQRLSHTPVIAILLFLAFSSVVFAQCPATSSRGRRVLHGQGGLEPGEWLRPGSPKWADGDGGRRDEPNWSADSKTTTSTSLIYVYNNVSV